MSLFKTIFKEGILEGVKAILYYGWPIVLPMLTAIGQYFTSVPLPYFFAALSVAVASSIWAIERIDSWTKASDIKNRILVSLNSVAQRVDANSTEEEYFYQLAFDVLNISKNFIFIRLTKLAWEVDNKTKERTEIEEDSGALPPQPGHSVIYSPTIHGLQPGHHSGKFTIKIEFGKTQEKIEYEISLFGTFKILESTHGNCEPAFKWHRVKYETKKLK